MKQHLIASALTVVLGLSGTSVVHAASNGAKAPTNTKKHVSAKISPEEVTAAQQAWCDALVAIGKTHKSGGDVEAHATKVITELYDYDHGKVFFKPTLAHGAQTFRTTKEGAVSYFVGGNSEYPGDKGFALKPWTKARFDNLGDGHEGIQIHGDTAITMGNVWVTAEDGSEVMVDKTFVFKKGHDGKLRLILHKSSLPYSPEKS